MAESMYIGVSNKACKVEKAYIGINGVAKEIDKIYIGVNGVAKLIFNNNGLESQLIDFEYVVNDDGTYSLTGWKGTLNGVASTEMVIPDNNLIIVNLG